MLKIIIDKPSSPEDRHLCATCSNASRITEGTVERSFCERIPGSGEIRKRVPSCSMYSSVHLYADSKSVKQLQREAMFLVFTRSKTVDGKRIRRQEWIDFEEAVDRDLVYP